MLTETAPTMQELWQTAQGRRYSNLSPELRQTPIGYYAVYLAAHGHVVAVMSEDLYNKPDCDRTNCVCLADKFLSPAMWYIIQDGRGLHLPTLR